MLAVKSLGLNILDFDLVCIGYIEGAEIGMGGSVV